ncbi:hypothetical protein [Alkalinema sp. FACHB-956]|uniref:hypothetical protein n=1 Tax=Alkalinema sp. FACHB-956 TaxID=2692768 RepID=UPI00168795B1|nr:hypothetical protein [Alkalinema sp. FACHB-956]MBD2327775.1 hypothetical protein [Alkalinema sp. FACHB-956]
MCFTGSSDDRRLDSPTPKELDIHLIGHRELVESTINQLHALRFSDRIRWSIPTPIPNSNGKYISILHREA